MASRKQAILSAGPVSHTLMQKWARQCHQDHRPPKSVSFPLAPYERYKSISICEKSEEQYSQDLISEQVGPSPFFTPVA